jgi:hypothetical protein
MNISLVIPIRYTWPLRVDDLHLDFVTHTFPNGMEIKTTK